MQSTFFLVVALIAIAIEGLSLILFFFEPSLRYKVTDPFPLPRDGKEAFGELEKVSGVSGSTARSIEVLTNGENYYQAELDAISKARRSITLEAYIFQRGEVAQSFLKALTERARNGVKVRVVMDAIGSFATTESYVKELTDAGGRVEFYHSLKWYLLPRINHRTHREIIVVDGHIGFLGGSGIADHWLYSRKKHPQWRDTMFRVEGECVAGLQAIFAENWLETSGEILTGDDFFPDLKNEKGPIGTMTFGSAPSSGRSTRSRIFYQTLLASATRSIHITTPYFLPDFSLRREIVRALERGVSVEVITPGKRSDHLLTRRSSRRLYGDLLKAGARIFEYQPSMIHAKILVIDDQYSIVGSTNFDNRSFGINDEVNLLAADEKLAERLLKDFHSDLSRSQEITYEQWRKRPFLERCHELGGALLERQQ